MNIPPAPRFFRGIGRKLFLWILIIALLPLAVVGGYTFNLVQESLDQEAKRVLTTVLELKNKHLEYFFANHFNQVNAVAFSKATLGYLQAINISLQKTGLTPHDFTKSFQWAVLQSEYHTEVADLVAFQQTFNYTNLLLIDSSGNVLYVTEPDEMLGHNMLQEPKSQSVLGESVRHTLKSNNFNFSGWEYDAQSSDAFSGFFLHPVVDDNGMVIGLIAMEINFSSMDAILQDANASTETLDLYLVNQEGIMQSNARFSQRATLPKHVVSSHLIQHWLSGSTHRSTHHKTHQTTTTSHPYKNYRNAEVLGRYISVHVLKSLNLEWALVAEMDTREAFAPIHHLRNLFLAVFAVVSLLVLFLSGVLTGYITKPIANLRNAAQAFGRGERDIQIAITSSDEIGELTHTFLKMIENINEQQEKLQQALALSDQATRSKSEFLANMSHEIRTPMNAIIGLSDLALRTELTPKTRDYLTKIASSSKSLLRIINDILDFSKIEAGKLEMESINFYLGDVFDHLADMFRNKAAEKDIELILDIPHHCPKALYGDSLRIEQILMNLISNAIKFTEHGEIQVGVRWDQKASGLTVESDTGLTDDHIVLEFAVRDTGIGLSQEQMVGLFEPFVQGDGSTTRKYGGTGLGLSISKRLVELMGGRIWAESKSGEGSWFRFTIVCAQRSELEKGDPIPPAAIKGLRVLVVDDNEMAREVLEAAMKTFSFSPTLVASGAEALAALDHAIGEGNPYKLVLLDYMMPGMNGIETANRIMESTSQLGANGALPKMILLTAYGREEAFVPLLEKAGIQAFLSKPVNYSLLFDTIMVVLGLRVAKRYQSGGKETDYTKIIDKIGGTHLLLVEDVLINQQVVSELLAGVGILVDVASNGAEAVQRVEHKAYDAVLMDIQMPVMDGYEATKAIRKKPRFAQLPIIAMTAHAMTGDREKCLAVGMNEHIGKPIDPNQLFSVLMAQIQPGTRAVVDREQLLQRQEQTTEESTVAAEIPGIDLKAALGRVMGNRPLLMKLLREFHRDYATVVADIRQALAEGDAERGRRLVHQVKGIAGNMGAREIFAAGQNLEQAIQQGQENEWPALLDWFEAALQNVLAAIANLPSPTEQETVPIDVGRVDVNPEPLDQDALRPALVALAGQLALSKYESIAAFAAIHPLLRQAGCDEEVEQLHDQLGRLKFKEARASLGAIAERLAISL